MGTKLIAPEFVMQNSCLCLAISSANFKELHVFPSINCSYNWFFFTQQPFRLPDLMRSGVHWEQFTNNIKLFESIINYQVLSMFIRSLSSLTHLKPILLFVKSSFLCYIYLKPIWGNYCKLSENLSETF